jgi:uncharacterized membrane protein SpoIIM required for sporulation
MDYARFVRLRRPLWDEFESRLQAARDDDDALGHQALETLALRYRQVLHDHALAGARFGGTGAARRLWRLALDGTHWLQRERGDRLPGPWTFVTRTFPDAFRAHLPYLALATALFTSAAVLGFVLAVLQPGMGMALLGPDRMEDLRNGKLWTEALTTSVPPALSSSTIATNNMSVALTGWAGGALAGLGALYVVLLNGLLLGAVFGITLPYGMADELLTFVSAHGPLEITLILTTAASGLGMGRALVAAEDRPRREAVQDAARRALVVLLGCLPWFVLLGVVEAFLSPSPELDPSVKALLGLGLESLFLVVALGPLRQGARS